MYRNFILQTHRQILREVILKLIIEIPLSHCYHQSCNFTFGCIHFSVVALLPHFFHNCRLPHYLHKLVALSQRYVHNGINIAD